MTCRLCNRSGVELSGYGICAGKHLLTCRHAAAGRAELSEGQHRITSKALNDAIWRIEALEAAVKVAAR